MLLDSLTIHSQFLSNKLFFKNLDLWLVLSNVSDNKILSGKVDIVLTRYDKIMIIFF